MSEKESRITSTIDWKKDGKQSGFLRIPHPRNTSAWGVLNVPITVIKNGRGPKILFTAGAHGDEFEGPVTLSRLARELMAEDVQGQVVILPAMNQAGLRVARRISPVDDKDMNRSYPGDADGTPTEMLTHYVATQLVSEADVVVDYHSGGYSLEFVPCAIMHKLPDQTKFDQTMAAIKKFQAPVTLVLEELDSGGMLDSYVESLGKIFVTTEFAGGANLNLKALRVAERGTWQMLKHFSLVSEDHPKLKTLRESEEPTEFLEVPDHSFYVSSPESGIFEPFIHLGDHVTKDQAVGALYSIDNPMREPLVLRSAQDGVVLAKRAPALTESGDCLVVVAREYSG